MLTTLPTDMPKQAPVKQRLKTQAGALPLPLSCLVLIHFTTIPVFLLSFRLHLIPVLALFNFTILLSFVRTSIVVEVALLVALRLTSRQLGIAHLESTFLGLLAATFLVRVGSQEAPPAVLEELMWVGCDGLHDCSPIQIQGTLRVGDVDAVKPLLDTIERLYRNGVDMDWSTMKVLVDKNEIEILESELKELAWLGMLKKQILPERAQDELLRPLPR